MPEPQKNPLEGVSLDQLDLSDPETRQYVSQYVDMTDPETALYFKSSDPNRPPEVPLQETGSAPVVTEPRKTGFRANLEEVQGVRPGLDPENEFGGPRFVDVNGVPLPNPLSTVRDIVDLGARGLEYAGAAGHTGLELLDAASVASGLADLPEKVGLDELAGTPGLKFLPGSMLGALGEAFPLGGAEVGLANPAAAAARRLAPETEQAYLQVAKQGTPEEILRFADEQGFALEPEAVQQFVKERDAGRPVSDTVGYRQQELPLEEQPNLPFNRPTLEDTLRKEAEDFIANKKEEPLPDVRQRELPLEEPVHQKSFDFGDEVPVQKAINARDTADEIPPRVSEAVDHINEITGDWENAPSIEVFDSFKDVPDVDVTALGVTRPDGSVALNMERIHEVATKNNLDPKDVVSSATFHESLGHYGLSQRFGEGLDSFLESLYNNSTGFKARVNKWMDENPDEYLDDVNPLARAAEEVLAEMSQEGKVTPPMYARARNWLKGLGREMGLQLKYSDGEIKTILGMAHDAVVKGPARDVTANGFRYSVRPMKERSVGKGSKGPLRGSIAADEEAVPPTTIGKFRSQRPVEDILAEVAPEKTRETWDQWIDEAGKIRMTGQMAQNLARGAEVPELKAAERFLLESSNRIFDLSKKVSQGLATERDVYLLGKEMERARNISESIQSVVSNSARILNSRKIEVASDRALSDGIRNMLRSLEKGDLENPEKLAKMAEKLVKGNKQAKAMSKAMDLLANALNFPRTIMSSFDLSAPLRQGIFFVGRKELWKNVPKMFKAFYREGNYDAVMAEIKSRPTYQLMEDSGLSLADLGGRLVDREERFISTWAEKIPVVGRGVRASERAYTGFLNKLRADVFDDLVRQYEKAGIDLGSHSPQAKGIADFVNNATGRGNLGEWSQAAPALSGIFFSPRLIASRVRLLNPGTYVKMDPIVRKNALKSLASFGGIATSVLSLAALAGANVETDPRSSDFAKIRVGDTRYDILGGFGQYLTLGARLATNEKKNVKGEVVELGKKYGQDTRLDVLLKFGINKESPVASFVTDYLRGKDTVGEPFDAKQAALERFIPLFLQDAVELTREEGAKGIPMSVPGLFGVGMQTYNIDLGYDAFGRDIKTQLEAGELESDPIALEVQRLNAGRETSVLAAAPSSVQDRGDRVTLTPEQKNEWQKTMGQYTHEYLKEDMASEEYQTGTDEEKVEIIKQTHRDAYEDTKADMLSTLFPAEEGVE